MWRDTEVKLAHLNYLSLHSQRGPWQFQGTTVKYFLKRKAHLIPKEKRTISLSVEKHRRHVWRLRGSYHYSAKSPHYQEVFENWQGNESRAGINSALFASFFEPQRTIVLGIRVNYFENVIISSILAPWLLWVINASLAFCFCENEWQVRSLATIQNFQGYWAGIANCLKGFQVACSSIRT